MTRDSAAVLADGYCVVRNVLDAPMLVRTRAHSRAVLDAVSPEHRAKQVATGSLIHIAADPFFAGLIAWQPALAALERLGLGDATFSSGYVISKPPHSPALFWHQDWWGWSDPISYTDRPLQVFLMYYLTDTRPENGCLRVVPGSHRRRHAMHDLLPSAHAEDLARVANPASPVYQSVADDVPVTVRAGDVVIGDARLLHGAYPNQSDEERTLITLWYHPHFRDQPEAMQARVAKITRREGVDTDAGGEAAPFPECWPAEQAAMVRPLVATYHGSVEPLPWSRVPGAALA
jgi:ectoine hydroxylase-related dioxygenase (phytanoyl-CoA dioxygenase family)